MSLEMLDIDHCPLDREVDISHHGRPLRNGTHFCLLLVSHDVGDTSGSVPATEFFGFGLPATSAPLPSNNTSRHEASETFKLLEQSQGLK